jgi:hypothetical protein
VEKRRADLEKAGKFKRGSGSETENVKKGPGIKAVSA